MATKPKLPSDMELRQQYMQQARFMVAFWQVQSARDYSGVLWRLDASKPLAGGPALRLANALWDFEYALKFPRSKVLKIREESSFARVYAAHFPQAPRHDYCDHVWHALPLFVQLRQEIIPQVIAADLLEKEALILPERQELVRAFWLLHKVRHRPYVQRIIRLFLSLEPRNADIINRMKIVAQAVYAFENFSKDWQTRLRTMQSLLRQPWVRQTALGDAINLFQRELDQRLSPV